MESLRIMDVALIARSICGNPVSYSYLYDVAARWDARNTVNTFVISRTVTAPRRIERTRVIIFASKNQFNGLTFYGFAANIADPTTNASFAYQVKVNSFYTLACFNGYAFAGLT